MTYENTLTYETIRGKMLKYTKTASCIFVFTFVLFVLISVLLPLTAQAQEASGIRIQPAIIEEGVNPGDVFSSIIRVTNLDLETKTLHIIKRNISRLSPDGQPIFAQEGEETGFEISSWIQIRTEPIRIVGGATEEIPFSIVVPEDASPGGHFGGIFLTFTPQLSEETGVSIGYQVGTIINMRISGEIFEEARIREFRTDKTIYSKPDVTFITRVENIGNVLIRPRGLLEITNFFGKNVATLRVNDEAAGVFPKAIRQFDTSWQGEGLAFGRYQAVLSLVYGQEGRKTISRVHSFWVLPLNIILSVVGSILGLILVVFIFVKLHIRRKVRQLREATENTVPPGRFKAVEEELFHHQKGTPFSRLALITTALLVFTLLFIVVLFFFFA